MSAYDSGLDILGAVGVARSALAKLPAKSKAAIKNMGALRSAAQRLLAAGQKLKSKDSAAGKAFTGIANRVLSSANAKEKQAAAVSAQALAAEKKQQAVAATAKALEETKKAKEAKASAFLPKTAQAAKAATRQAVQATQQSVLATRQAARATGAAKIAKAVARPQAAVRIRGAASPAPSALPSKENDPIVFLPSPEQIEQLAKLASVMNTIWDCIQAFDSKEASAWAVLTSKYGGDSSQPEKFFGDFGSSTDPAKFLKKGRDLVARIRTLGQRIQNGQFAVVNEVNQDFSQIQPLVDEGMTWLSTAEEMAQSGAFAKPTTSSEEDVPSDTSTQNGTWAPNTAYAVGASVTSGASSFMAIQAGTSGTTPPVDNGMGAPIQDGTVLWMSNAQSTYDPYASGGGGGGGGGGEGGGGEGGYEEEAAPAEAPFEEAPAPAGGDSDGMDFAVEDDGGSLDEVTEEGYSDFYEEPLSEDPLEDTFLEESAIAESDAEMLDMAEDLKEMEEMLGLDFKASYIFAPWEAGTDYDIEKNKAPEGGVLPSSGEVRQAPQAKIEITPAQRMKLQRAQEKLAAARGRYAPSAMTQQEIFDESYYAPLPSETFADRLAISKQMQSIEGENAVKEDLVSLDDVADILIDSWTQDITDEPADPTRRTASLHHGAAYLEERAYPRYGASSGQEGGMMFPRETITIGETYDTGAEILGAGPQKSLRSIDRSAKNVAASTPRAQFVSKKTAGGNKIVSMMTNRTKSNKSTIANARDVAKRAISTGKRLGAAVAKGKVKPASKVPGTRVRGDDDGEVFYGVVQPPKKGFFGKKKPGVRPKLAKRLSPVQLKKLATLTVKAGEDLQKYAAKHEALLNKALKKEDAAKMAVRRKMNKPKVVKASALKAARPAEMKAPARPAAMKAPVRKAPAEMLRGEDYEADEVIFGAEFDVCFGEALAEAVACELVGQGVVSYSDPQPIGTPAVPGQGAPPANPGYGAGDATGGFDVTALDAADPNWGQGPMPTMETISPPDFTPDPGAGTDWDTKGAGLPEGAIIAPSDRVTAPKAVGSRSFYNRRGGIYWMGDRWNGQWGSWDGVLWDWGSDSLTEKSNTDASNRAYAWLAAKVRAENPDSTGNDVNNAMKSLSTVDADAMSRAAGWGALIGDPKGADKGLRYDPVGDQWYWFWNAAPKEEQAPIMQLRLAQAIAEWKMNVATAKTDAAAQAIQDQIDAEEAKAIERQNMLEDAALARQQEMEAQQAMHDADVQALADEAASRQEQSVLDRDIQAAQAQAEIDRANLEQEYALAVAADEALANRGEVSEEAAEEAAVEEALEPSFEEDAADVAEEYVEEALSEEEAPSVDYEDLPTDPAGHEAFDTGEFNLEEEEPVFEEESF